MFWIAINAGRRARAMAKGEVVINESHCLGCGYCEHFCPQGCIVVTGEKYSSFGYLLPVFANEEKCNACGICEWMCPHFGIEVYKYVEAEA
jgi:2-oxoglutarate ferredoxin oxidoreductase subunit delta